MPFNIDSKQLNLISSPHVIDSVTNRKVMIMVIISLLPLCIYGVVLFGISALILMVTSIVSCVAFEYLSAKFLKKTVLISNCSAIITGILLALTVSPHVSVWMIIIGSFFAIVVGKEFFGGIGSNVFNPALIGRSFMVLSFAKAMGSYPNPVDGVSGATTLGLVKSGALEVSAHEYWRYFVGYEGGTIGETSVLLILIAALFLIITKVIDWRAPVFMVGTVAFCIFLAGGDVLAHVLSGGLIFGAVFMATDYVTAPVTPRGRIIFGIGCGLITFLIRQFGGLPEGVMFSILIMNTMTPFLNKIVVRKYGYPKKFGGKK